MPRFALLLLALLAAPFNANSEPLMDYGVLIISRERLEVATPCDIGIYLQNQLVTLLYQGQSASFNLPPGQLSIRMGMLGGTGCIPAFEQIRGEHIELKAGEIRKYRIALGGNGLYLVHIPSAP
ncbi:MAG: hypothetical protein A2Y50_02055 [Pseudomonadales bacterium RIFCSPLOWO2_12_59_9]|nr:MAG: hypothetical protein A2Y50_02055 [Pseudomonadales bacterium RIFCSPLOWO2_12_59_9]